MKKKDKYPYQCWLCGEKFTHFIKLKEHIRRGIHLKQSSDLSELAAEYIKAMRNRRKR